MDVISNSLLIVDNEPITRRDMRQLAMKLDYEVEEANSASAALEHFGVAPPNMIVIDLNLPDTDGIRLLVELAQLECKAAILIIGSFENTILEAAENVGLELGLRILGATAKPALPSEFARWLELARVKGPSISDHAVRSALDNGEFSLHYQPTFSRVGDRPWYVSGVTAYVRWEHPEFGLLRPGQFLRDVENTGLLNELTDKLVLEAMQHVRYWQDRGMSLTVGISIPWRLIADPSTPERLDALARETNINPSKLVLNIFDFSDSSKLVTGCEVLARLRLREFQIVYDGFTDLRSSIVNLVKLPFTAVNLDSTLSSLASSDAGVARSISTILAVAQELELEVHAKCVATQQDLDKLEELGCRSVRGHLFSREMPASQIEDFVRHWNKIVARPALELAYSGTVS